MQAAYFRSCVVSNACVLGRPYRGKINFIGKLKFGAGLLGLALFGLAGPVPAQNWDFQPRYLEHGLYTEGWDQIFYFPDGTLLVTQFTVTNVSFGDHNAGVLGVLHRPNKLPVVIKKSRRKGKWVFAKDQFDFSVAHNRLGGKAPDYGLAIRRVSGEIELDFKAKAPIWQLGQTVQTEDGFQYVSFYAPLAVGQVRYRLPIDDNGVLGDWHELRKGVGFAARYINSAATDDLFRTTTRVVSLEPKGPRPVIYLVQRLDGTWRVHVALFDQDRLLHTAISKDGKGIPVNHKLPQTIKIAVSDANFSLTGKIKINTLLGRLDPVELLKPYVRVFIRLFNTPVNYRYLAKYDLTYASRGGKPQKLSGQALLDQMQHSLNENSE